MSAESLGQLVHEYASQQLQAILDAERPLRRREPLVHATRVAIRRLRATLRTFREVYDEERAAVLAEEVRWFALLLGEVRDLDVLQKRLREQLARLPEDLLPAAAATGRRLDAAIERRRGAAWRQVHRAMSSRRYRALRSVLRSWLDAPPFAAEVAAEQPEQARRFVRKAEKVLHRRIQRGLDAAHEGEPDAPQLLHSARKAGKRHRYAVELAASTLGEHAEELIERRRRLQEALGERQDAIVSYEFLLATSRAERSPSVAFVLGFLTGQERALLDRDPDEVAEHLEAPASA